jgi:hypothetical protein
MATYKGINGFAVQSVATDPSPLDEGQVWYNNATYAFKLAALTTVGSWATGGNMGTGSSSGFGSNLGTQTAALFAAGKTQDTPPSANFTTATQLYDGTSWTASTAVPGGRITGSALGTQTAGLIMGGFPPAFVATNTAFSFDGSSWTSAPNLASPLAYQSSVGIQTAGLCFGVRATPAPPTQSQNYNGSAWTSGPSMNTSHYGAGAAGVQTAALAIAGAEFPGDTQISAVESYNGSSWTSVTGVNTARVYGAGFGIQTSALFFGGLTTPGAVTDQVESWNGSSWTTSPASLSGTRYQLNGCGSISAGLAAGGAATGGGSSLTTTQEFIGPGAPVTQTITTS